MLFGGGGCGFDCCWVESGVVVAAGGTFFGSCAGAGRVASDFQRKSHEVAVGIAQCELPHDDITACDAIALILERQQESVGPGNKVIPFGAAAERLWPPPKHSTFSKAR